MFPRAILELTIDATGSWTLGIGDPTPIGWLTFAAYLGTAVLCWLCSRGNRQEPLFWQLLAIALVLFGCNKQLDLQDGFTVAARHIARAGNLYGRKHELEIAFMALLAILGTGIFGTLAWKFRRVARRNGLAFLGLGFFAFFVVVRGASIYGFDRALRARIWGLRLNWIMEFGAIGTIALAAILHLSHRRRELKP